MEDTQQHAHFIGIGGIGMSSLARLLLHDKWRVSGSDAEDKPLLDDLENEGVAVSRSQSEVNIDPDTDLFIYTEAIPVDHPERVAAHATGKPVVNYFEALAKFVNPYYLIAVAGTHGKTTTTAMLTDVFEAAGKDPTAVIGSLRTKTGSNFRPGKSKYAIVEACEYRRDFLHLTPDVLVITNIEHEHVDYYRSLEEVQQAFRELVAKVHDTGVIVANTKDSNVQAVVRDAHVPVIDYMEYFEPQLQLQQPGMHNRLNAAAALAVAEYEKLSVPQAKNALEDFAGTWRRFQKVGECNGAPVYDDYAHHPTEIELTIAGARELYPERNVVVVFQPHTYSRTEALFGEFAKALGRADQVYILPVYAARKEEEKGVSSRELAVKTIEYQNNASYAPDFDTLVDIIKGSVNQTDVVLVLGAGDVPNVSQRLIGSA